MTISRQRPILVVDDSSDLVGILRDLLDNEHYAAETYLDPSLALERLHRDPAPCMMMVDLRMDPFDGIEFIELARGFGCRAPIALMTADPPPAEDVLKRLGIVEVLRKPFELGTFLEIVQRVAHRECPDVPEEMKTSVQAGAS